MQLTTRPLELEALDAVAGGSDDDYYFEPDNSFATTETNNDTFGGGYEQIARVTDVSSGEPIPHVTNTRDQIFDDGTELRTFTYSDGNTVSRSRETDVQTFDDGSRLYTTTENWGSQTYTDTRSMDSLESRVEYRGWDSDRPGFLIDDARTATRDDIQTARDVLDNYGYQLNDEHRAIINDYINEYYTGAESPIYRGAPPTPQRYPTPEERGGPVFG